MSGHLGDVFEAFFGVERDKPAEAFVVIVAKSPTATLAEVQALADAMGLEIQFRAHTKERTA